MGADSHAVISPGAMSMRSLPLAEAVEPAAAPPPLEVVASDEVGDADESSEADSLPPAPAA